MQIRNMKIEDKESIFRLYHVLNAKYENDIESLKMALIHPTTDVFVLEENSQVVGTATLSYRITPFYGMIGIIDDLVVDPSYQRKGFGRELSVHCINVARQKGCKRIELTSKPSRIEANKLYKSLGFKKKVTNAYILKL